MLVLFVSNSLCFLLLSIIIFSKSSFSTHREYGNVREGIKPNQLYCIDNAIHRYNISPIIFVMTESVESKGFQPSCPVAHNVLGNGMTANMCYSGNLSYFCTFYMTNVKINSLGGLFQSNNMISMNHDTLYGKSLLEAPAWIQRLSQRPHVSVPIYDIVIPTRLHWDDCFNHLSFSSLPIIASAYELLKDKVATATWHASLFTAAILNLMGIPLERIIIEKNVHANIAILPWVPKWDPIWHASLHGLTNNICKMITNKLLTTEFHVDKEEVNRLKDKSKLPTDTIIVNNWHNDTIYKNYLNDPTDMRYIIFLTRDRHGPRGVINEIQILKAIKRELKGKYKVIVLSHTKEWKTVHMLHISWQRYAKIIHRAIAIIGPHGGAMNNLMWAPDDCHIIEFNELPDRMKVGFRGDVYVRRVFFNAWWAKGTSTGKFFVIEVLISTLWCSLILMLSIGKYEAQE